MILNRPYKLSIDKTNTYQNKRFLGFIPRFQCFNAILTENNRETKKFKRKIILNQISNPAETEML
jgi:hypothetical protein